MTIVTVAVVIRDLNEVPVINSSTSRYVLENSAVGTTLASLGAADQDAGAVLTYIASYPTDVIGMFIVETSTGAIVITGAIDFERTTQYSLSVWTMRPWLYPAVDISHALATRMHGDVAVLHDIVCGSFLSTAR
jgi:hypothetical protein